MNIVIGLMVMTATVVLGMNEGDEGVCQMEETFVMSTTVSTPTSYSRRSTSCSIIFFLPLCSSSYRTAYRTSTRTTYSIALRNISLCCERYVEINGTCKREETTTVPTTTTTTILLEKPLTRTEIIFIPVAISAFFVVLILIILIVICKKKRALPRSPPNPPHG
ncbi:uncharacterized protein [Apostichopus japonicus]|uniref:uncharacterized protein n=1 Tax=Stichopus japonicus TaxID=307972 RepID=UPI003AB9023C